MKWKYASLIVLALPMLLGCGGCESTNKVRVKYTQVTVGGIIRDNDKDMYPVSWMDDGLPYQVNVEREKVEQTCDLSKGSEPYLEGLALIGSESKKVKGFEWVRIHSPKEKGKEGGKDKTD